MPEEKKPSLEEELKKLGQEKDSSDTQEQPEEIEEPEEQIAEESEQEIEEEPEEEKPSSHKSLSLDDIHKMLGRTPEKKSDDYTPLSLDFLKPGEETVEVIKGLVSVSIVYRKRIYPFLKEEMIYVTAAGKKKKVYEVDKNRMGPEKAIQNIVLSPDEKRIAFDLLVPKHFFYSGYEYGQDMYFKSIHVVDIDGKNLSSIAYHDLDIELPKSKSDIETEEERRKEKEERKKVDPLYEFRRFQENQKEIENHKIVPSPEAVFYSPEWVSKGKNKGRLEFKAKLYYPFRDKWQSSFSLSAFLPKGYSIHSGPECLVRAELDKENQIENAELIRVFD